jgi:hypothetical protein
MINRAMRMRCRSLAVAVIGIVLGVAFPGAASARVWVGFGVPLFVGPPAYYPPPTYYPAAAYYARPVQAWIPAHWQNGYWVPGHYS